MPVLSGPRHGAGASSDADDPIARGDVPLVPRLAVRDDVGAPMQGEVGADVRRDGQQPGADRKAIGRGRLDDQVLLAVADELRLGQVDQVHARAGRVGGDGLVAEVQAEPAGPGRLTTRVNSRAAGVNGRSG